MGGNLHPDHDTLATFRRTFLQELKELFVQVLLRAQEAGVLKLGTMSLEGTKIHADARHSESNQLQAAAGIGGTTANRGRGTVHPQRTKRPARGTRWASGKRGDRTARGPLDAADGSQSLSLIHISEPTRLG